MSIELFDAFFKPDGVVFLGSIKPGKIGYEMLKSTKDSAIKACTRAWARHRVASGGPHTQLPGQEVDNHGIPPLQYPSRCRYVGTCWSGGKCDRSALVGVPLIAWGEM